MRRKVWPFSYKAILDDFLQIPDSLKKCIEQYFSPETKDFFAQIRKKLKSLTFSRVLFIGNTFNFYACLVPIYCLNIASENKYSHQAFEISEFNDYILPVEPDESTLYIFISKSGESRLLKKAIDKLFQLKIDHNLIWLVTNEPKIKLAQKLGVVFPIHVDSEIVLGVKSFQNTVFVLFLISQLLLGKDALNDDNKIIMDNILNEMQEFRRKNEQITAKILDFFGINFEFLYYISKGASLSSAYNAALAAKSFGRLFGEGVSLGLFFHGPFQIADENSRFILIKGDYSEDLENNDHRSLLSRLIDVIIEKLGPNKIILLSNNEKLSSEMENNSNVYVISFKCGISALSPILEMFILHLINLELAEKKLDLLL